MVLTEISSIYLNIFEHIEYFNEVERVTVTDSAVLAYIFAATGFCRHKWT
jgi:hypothetical protein